jgi:hypothetical protein
LISSWSATQSPSPPGAALVRAGHAVASAVELLRTLGAGASALLTRATQDPPTLATIQRLQG